MDAQPQIEAELEGLYKDHHTAVVTSLVAAHQDKRIRPLAWEATMNVVSDKIAGGKLLKCKQKKLEYTSCGAELYNQTKNIKGYEITLNQLKLLRPE